MPALGIAGIRLQNNENAVRMVVVGYRTAGHQYARSVMPLSLSLALL